MAEPTGYLSRGRPAARPGRSSRPSQAPTPPYVLTVLGGGSDGAELARLAAAARAPHGCRHLLVTGPQIPVGALEELREIADEDTTVVRSAPDVPELIAGAAAVVSMGGYNTIAELLVTDTPALVVPRSRRRQEQPRRAEALAAVGALETRRIEDLDPSDITAWWARAVTTRAPRTGIDLDGLEVVPRLAAALLERSPRSLPILPEVHSHAV
jgi:predicted glycosyltransferase